MRLGVYSRESLPAGPFILVLVLGIALLLAAISLLEMIDPSVHTYPF